MAIEFLTFHHEFIPNFATNNEQNDIRPYHIIQYAKVAGAEFGQRGVAKAKTHATAKARRSTARLRRNQSE
jgi:hypothetical protein